MIPCNNAISIAWKGGGHVCDPWYVLSPTGDSKEAELIPMTRGKDTSAQEGSQANLPMLEQGKYFQRSSNGERMRKGEGTERLKHKGKRKNANCQ